MPSREAVREILDGLFAALFPAHYGLADFSDEGVDYFVGQNLDATLRTLLRQVERELQFASPKKEALARPSIRGHPRFCSRFPSVRALLESDILAAYQGDPAARSIEEVRFCYPGITGITHHRLAHELYLLDSRCSRASSRSWRTPPPVSTSIRAPRLTAASSSTTAPAS